ncbi:hypothetical protein LOK49_LG12G00555 [Camellia lanceoleosa]|uniref:Uncharacterized protein n=1 Tax=Camellia lanceoleosa TaxID=1840588 RepID=A0ACC0FSC9_9ERIC|nr:hypothetical protein LOK49_LG12G00555 [Camellia lanceoleosa]
MDPNLAEYALQNGQRKINSIFRVSHLIDCKSRDLEEPLVQTPFQIKVTSRKFVGFQNGPSFSGNYFTKTIPVKSILEIEVWKRMRIVLDVKAGKRWIVLNAPISSGYGRD